METYTNKTVLVTGATGLIGSHIVDVLMSMRDVRVIALSRSQEKLKNGFKRYLNNARFQIVAHNMSEPFTFDEPIHYIFHAAGPMERDTIRNRPMDVILPNLAGTYNCLEFMKCQAARSGIRGRVILFSSVTIYGNNQKQDLTVTEADTCVTETLESISAAYSQSKRMSEVIALAYYRQFGVDVVIARISTVYGCTRYIPKTAFFEFIQGSMRGENILMERSDLPRRDNIYIDDAVAGILLIGAAGAAGEPYNISSNGELDNYASLDEIAQTIASVVNGHCRDNAVQVLFRTPMGFGRQPGLKLDNTKLKNLGWTVTVGLRAGIERTIAEMKSMHEKEKVDV